MKTQEKEELTGETILPCVPEIFIDERMGEYLVLNPLGPWWFIGSRLHADFARLCDGKRSLWEIRESLLKSGYDELTKERTLLIAQSLQKAQFFTKTDKIEMRLLNVVFFNITKRCNLRCPYCYYDSVPVAYEAYKDELDAEEWIELAGKIAEINPQAKIIISGGEPLLRPDTVSIIENIAARYNLTTKLVTNGTLFTKETISRLSNIKNFSIQVSIDSIIPEINEKTRGKGSLEKSMEAVRQLKAAGIEFDISSTVTRVNLSTIRQFREYCLQNQYSYRSSVFTLSGNVSKTNGNWLELSPEEYLDASTYALEYFDPNTTMGHPIVPGLRRYGCGMGYSQIDISPDGSVFPCSHLIESQFYIGNIRTSDLRQLVAEGQQRYVSCDVDNDAYCTTNQCSFRYLCAGGCRATTYNNFGTMDTKAKNCEQLKQSYINALWVSMLGPAYKEKDSDKEAG